MSALRAMLIVNAIGAGAIPSVASAEVGQSATAIADCVSANNSRILGVDVKWIKDDSVHVLPNSSTRFTFLAGKLGSHITWLALLDMEARPVSAFETHDEYLRTGPSGIARHDVPFIIKRALKTCDVTWLGAPPQQLVDEFLSDF